MFPIKNWIDMLARPKAYEPGAELWNDTHISQGMMKAHLDPDLDAASYKLNTIKAICKHLPASTGIKEGAEIVDLGCGPGLYAKELCQMGYRVTGIDLSENSLRYARELNKGMQAVFYHDSYTKPFGNSCFDAALFIYEDYGVLPPKDRQRVIDNVYRALKPGGWFALDVCSMKAFQHRKKNAAFRWEAAQSGFWRPHPYILLEHTHIYDDIPAICDMYGVIDHDMTVYRVWQTFFTPDTISQEMHAGGFAVRSIWGNLQGEPITDDSTAIGILCQKV